MIMAMAAPILNKILKYAEIKSMLIPFFFFPSKVTSKQVLFEIRGMIRAISDPNFDGK